MEMPKRKRLRKVKRKIKIKNLVLFLIVILCLLVVLPVGIKTMLGYVKETLVLKKYYLGSNGDNIDLYTYDLETETMIKTSVAYRGVMVNSYDKVKTVGEENYTEITFQEESYFVKSNVLVENIKDCVQETEKYIRTSVTVYENEEDSKIESFIKKGNKLRGFKQLLDEP